MAKPETGIIVLIAAGAAALFYAFSKSTGLGTQTVGAGLASTASPRGSASGILTPVNAFSAGIASVFSAFTEPSGVPLPSVGGPTGGSAGGVSNPTNPQGLQLQSVQTATGPKAVGILDPNTGKTTLFTPTDAIEPTVAPITSTLDTQSSGIPTSPTPDVLSLPYSSGLEGDFGFTVGEGLSGASYT